MKLNKNNLRKMILKEMADMSQFHGGGMPTYSQGEREGYDDYKEATGVILDKLYQALEAASVYPGHEDLKAIIQSCIANVENSVVI